MNQTGAPVVFDPSQTTITIDNTYITGLGESPISFDYSQDAVSGTCTLPLKLSSPQYSRMVELAKNHTTFQIWCTDKSSGRRAGGNYAMFTRVPTYTADTSDVTFNMLIADLDIGTC